MEINVLIDGDFSGCPEENWIRSVAEQTLLAQGVSPDVEIGLVFTSQEKVRELNRSYRGKDRPTDVLAFYMVPPAVETELSAFVTPPDGVHHLGEVIISYPQTVLQAQARRHSVKKEMAILIIHGVLHLLGYDHEEPEPGREMSEREAAILNNFTDEPDRV